MIKSLIKEWLIEKLIPWFMKYIWPEISKAIKKYIILYVGQLIKQMMNFLKVFFEKRSQNSHTRQEHARHKYEEAKQQEAKAQQPEEADKYKAVAEVWREVFEQFREENEQLKEDLKKATEFAEKLSSKAKNDVGINMVNFGVDRMMGSKIDSLPDLPKALFLK